jgi:transposase InsO family protein
LVSYWSSKKSKTLGHIKSSIQFLSISIRPATSRAFFGEYRDELMSCEISHEGSELQSALEGFQDHYNNRRPHLGLGGLTPIAFKRGITTQSKEEILGG